MSARDEGALERDDFEDGIPEAPEEEETEARASVGPNLSGTPSWFLSGGFHTALLLVLSLLAAAQIAPAQPTPFAAQIAAPVEPPPVVEPPPPDIPPSPVPIYTDNPVTQPFFNPEETEVKEPMATLAEVEMPSPVRGEEMLSTVALGNQGLSDALGVGGPPGGMFGPRIGGSRHPGTGNTGPGRPPLSETLRALRWLANHQETDGRWDCSRHGGGGNKREQIPDGFDEAMTGLAVLAFLGAGCTDEHGPFTQAVQKGIYWLETHQRPDGSWAGSNYTHNICTLAAAEIYGMTGKHKEMAEKALRRMVSQQTSKGGWDYGKPGSRSDTSITGWAVMAAKSAKLADLDVPDSLFAGALKHFTAAGAGESSKQGRVFYSIGATGGKEKDPNPGSGDAQTVIAMLAMLYLGQSADHPWAIRASEQTIRKGILLNNFYYIYYGALAMFQTGGASWDAWNLGMKKALGDSQIKDNSDNDGSWDPEPDRYGVEGGRVYTTALGAMSLEVYYRYNLFTKSSGATR
ncbi:MAG: prenyltransferase/squalene oxidase repeat-containing protein [Planctomycetota bacterium]